MWIDLEIPDEELARLGREGIGEAGAGRRGPLALDLASMLAIREHFRGLGRAPTDVELEALGQSWSEHCRHRVFNSPIDGIPEGLFRRYIRGATEAILSRRSDGFCVSVFEDNAGAVSFDEDWLVVDKVETHNSPSALDPYQGALTGVLGVNRDILGFGLGARPILNRYGFCVAASSGLAEGIFRGVEAAGNQSGVPTSQGFLLYDEGYRAKPLVFVGTVGLIPRRFAGKRARPGDRILVVGGRTGLDGIHGATVSSGALGADTPRSSVPPGDPFAQRKLWDALLAARDAGLLRSLTDNGAGGLGCSVPEMAREAGGCIVHLDRVPLKRPDLLPWQIWVSESQERMTLAVEPGRVEEVWTLFSRLEVEAADIGEFTDTGRCEVYHGGELVLSLSLDFLLDGWPPLPLKTKKNPGGAGASGPCRGEGAEPLPTPLPPTPALPLFSPPQLTLRFDHEVQGTCVLKPYVGRGREPADAVAHRPLPHSWKGVAVAAGLCPDWTELDPYAMAVWSVDAAIRPLVALGARLDRISLQDNFCWSGTLEPERLWLLKEAARGCHDAAVGFGTPFISGKDSLHNESVALGAEGRPGRRFSTPTLLISSLAVVADVRRLVTLDAKAAGDCLILVGGRKGLVGERKGSGSAGQGPEAPGPPGIFFSPLPLGEEVGVFDSALRAYRAQALAAEAGLVSAAIGVGRGGVRLASRRMARAGGLRLEGNFDCGSEAPGRLLVACRPEALEELLGVFRDAAALYSVLGHFIPEEDSHGPLSTQ